MKNKSDILAKIKQRKQQEVAEIRLRQSQYEIQAATMPEPRGFLAALEKSAQSGPALIAEIKKASPSKGVIREDFSPTEIARAYTDAGASCLSVLTDGPGFQGSALYLKQALAISPLPVLRKDFMIDPVQITESRALGADAILIILALVNDETAFTLLDEANRHGMDALVEVHSQSEMRRANKLGAKLIGINNRDLKSFNTSLDNFKTLAPLAHAKAFLVAESGIKNSDDILELTEYGAQGFLVGESLMRADDIALATKQLLGKTA